MMKGGDAFEGAVRNALAHYEVPFNSADWAKLEKRMEQGGRNAQREGSAAMSVLILAGAMSIAATGYFLLAQGGAPGPDPFRGHAPAMVADQWPDRQSNVTPPEAAAPAPGQEPAPVDAVAALPVPDPAGKDDRPAAPAPVPTEEPPAAATVEAVRPEAMVRPSASEACPGVPITFDLGELPEEGIHLWNFGDGSFSNKPGPTHTYTKPGRYEVMLSHSSEGGGNFSNRPVSVPIVIHEAPHAQFQPVARHAENMVPTMHFENRSMGGKHYHWDLGDGHTSDRTHPDHVYRAKGVYTVVLTATNDKGCVDRTEARVTVEEDYALNAPKTFSPNNDGVSDTFMPEALRHLGIPFQLTIYDAATGQLVFTADRPTDRWNGRAANTGEMCPEGDYVWMVELKDGGRYGNFNGTVSLVR
ncbi:MAG: PKD domain-containing protein [Flavobacteriales bacterium]|jgi:gliding motility-associated-like protein|nr:PKD domain-containing protein [Flavobacteriales bacterium]